MKAIHNFIKPVISLTIAILQHKFYLLCIGPRFGVSVWRILTHDLSKFSPNEFWGYAIKYHGMLGDLKKWNTAWEHHKGNDHHWEYWIPTFKNVRINTYLVEFKINDGEPQEMSELAVREMVADWFASTRWHTGKWPMKECWPWWENEFDNVILHKRTDGKVRWLINNYFRRYPNVN